VAGGAGIGSGGVLGGRNDWQRSEGTVICFVRAVIELRLGQGNGLWA
jgi:hypothetical protein